MKKFLPSILIMLFSIAVYATPPSKESLEKLYNLKVQKEMDRALLTSVSPSAMSNVVYKKLLEDTEKKGEVLSTEKKQFLQKMANKIAESTIAVLKNMVIPRLKDEYIQVYSQTFSQEEIDSMITYYSTPMGQNLLEKSASADSILALKLMGLASSKEVEEKVESELMNNLFDK